MYQTLIPLDIAYLDSRGNIVSIKTMQPCTEDNAGDCPRYKSGADFNFALEVNGGFLSRHQVSPGDRVILDDKQCTASRLPD